VRKRTRHRRRGAQIVPIIILILMLTAALSGVGVLAYQLKLAEENSQAMAIANEQALTEFDLKVNELNARALELEAERDAMEVRATELKTELDLLSNTYASTDEIYASLNSQLTDLKAQIAERDAEIAMLNNSIATLELSYSIDINAQLDVIQALEELLNNPPKLKETTETKDKDGKITKKTTVRTPSISLYYEDIENGYTYSYRGDTVYDSASCIKAPYALSLLTEATKEYEELTAAGTDIASAELVYDFTGRSITYTKDMEEEGSGKIKENDPGMVYTHLDLMEYMLKYSDNVGYAQLKNAYGTQMLSDFVVKNRLTSMYKKMSNMSASDGGKIMHLIYDYMESGAVYSEFMYNAMLNSTHTVMIGYAVSPAKTVHKYGWDKGAYHDMAIVYDEHPFILVIMSDMDAGGDEVNEYIQSVVDQVEVLHDNFYSSELNK